MSARWTTEDIAREFGYNSRASVRARIMRWRRSGVVFDVEIDPLTGEKRYLCEEIRTLTSG